MSDAACKVLASWFPRYEACDEKGGDTFSYGRLLPLFTTYADVRSRAFRFSRSSINRDSRWSAVHRTARTPGRSLPSKAGKRLNKSVSAAGETMSEPVRNSVDSTRFTPSASCDPDISALAATALDGTKLVNQISLLPTSQRPWGAPQEARIKLLCFHPEPHCTFEIDLRTQSGWYRMIGKVYATDRGDLYQVMEGLRRAGFGPEGEFSIPRPLAYLPSLRLLLQERVDGMMAKEIFKLGDGRQCAAAAERCGRWLGRFQALAPPSGQISGVERFLRSAERKCRLISEADTAWAPKSQRLLEQLRASALSLAASPTCAGHGDYCEHQIVFAKGRTVVFDWDLYDISHPARDVAKFIVSLERLAMKHLGSIRALDGAAEVFLRAYLASGGHPHVAPALPFYKAVLWLKGRTKAIQTGAAGWREQTEIMVGESFRNIASILPP